MISTSISSITFALLAALVKSQTSHTYDGALVAAQLRCQGYLCPQWALDISRYDTVQYPQTQFEYLLEEPLPLAPTSQRKFATFTAYDEETRIVTVAAADYPVIGVDSFWQSSVNSYINGTTPLLSNVMIAHPDASPNSPGSMHISRVLTGPEGSTFIVFKDGTLHGLDLKSKSYTKLVNLFDGCSFKAGIVTDAHLFDGSVLKSFVKDSQGSSYLVKTDLSTGKAVVSNALLIVPIQGYENKQLTPIAAHMMKTNNAMTPQLAVIMTGTFDTISFVDEVTGKQDSITFNLMEDAQSIISCNEDTFDCDFWRTSSFDKKNNILYFQAHVVDSQGMASTTILKCGFTQSKVSGIWYPYFNQAIWPMNFGYSGYQYVSME